MAKKVKTNNDLMEIGKIRKKISEFRNNTVWLQKKARWDGDYNLYNLKPYSPQRGYFGYTSNAPRVYADKLIAMLIDAKLNVRFPLDLLVEPERTIANNIERFFYGCLNWNDERLLNIVDMSSLRQQRAFYSVVFGSFARLAYVYKDDDGQTHPLIQTWDIYNTAYGKGAKGLTWAAHTKKVTREEIIEEWGVPKSKLSAGQQEFELTDYWTDKINAIIIGEDLYAKPPTPHGLDYNPVTIHRVGAQVPMYGRVDALINASVGESAFKANRDLEPIMNKVMSDLITVVHRAVKVPLLEWRKDGKSHIDRDIWNSEQADAIPLAIGEDVKPAIPTTMPVETQPLLALVSGEKQRGSLPHTAYGELGFRLSGFAINQLQGSLETVVAPFVTCLNQAYKMDCIQLLNQYAKEAWNPVNIRGRTSRNETFGYPKAQVITPDDLEKDWIPEIELIPTLPKDDAQKMQLAQLARQPDAAGVPLLSDRTILDELVEDPDLEQKKKDQQFGDNLQVNRMWKAYLAALADAPNIPVQENMPAMNVLAGLRMMMTGQMPGQGKPTPLQNASMGTPGAGMPPDGTGVSTDVMPSEMMGGLPGGAMNAVPEQAGAP